MFYIPYSIYIYIYICIDRWMGRWIDRWVFKLGQRSKVGGPRLEVQRSKVQGRRS